MGRIAQLLGIGFDWTTRAVTAPADLKAEAIVEVAKEPRTVRRARVDADPFAELEAVAARHKLTPQAVAAHFAKLAKAAGQRQADVEAVLREEGEGEAEQKKQSPPPRKARAG